MSGYLDTTGLKPLDPDHVHTRACHGRCLITYTRNGVTQSWGVGIGCRDTEESIRAHLAKWEPGAVFVSANFEDRKS